MNIYVYKYMHLGSPNIAGRIWIIRYIYIYTVFMYDILFRRKKQGWIIQAIAWKVHVIQLKGTISKKNRAPKW